MEGSSEVFRRINNLNALRRGKVSYTALTPNIKGVQQAIDCGVKEIAIFGYSNN